MVKLEEKSLRDEILKLAWPAILEMMLRTLVWTFDTAMVGRLTPQAISGVNLGGQIMYTISNVIGGLGIGATVLVSRYIGAMKKDKAEKVGTQSLSLGIIIAVVIGIVGIFSAERIFKIIVKDPVVVKLGTEYLKIVYVGMFFLIPLMIGNFILRGVGNTVVPMVSAAVSNLVNIVGDYVLIFGKFGFPRLETKGAALATTFAQIIGAVITFYYLFRGDSRLKLNVKEMFKFHKDDLKSIFSLSIPAVCELGMDEGSRLVCGFWIAQLGAVSYASHSISVAAESLSFMPGYGFAIAATTLVGQSLGSKNVEKAEKSTKKSVKYSTILMGIVGLLFFIVPYPIMRFFSSDKQTVLLASECIKIGAFEQIPTAILMTVSGALKGAGDTKGPFKISIVMNFMVRLPLIFMIVFVFKLSVIYVWVATVFQYIIGCILMILRYKRGNWKKINL